ncbi:acetyl-CoA carboxylase biotin carboxyl carrier protein subunit [Actinoallomurus acaciae]|uniref:Acetyl-CoA carboxylase biotin carboxyl carrier protein subunit n=1 Tax=Actinoallomurus acaciae TaxID=502577 RepID=A0ABV5YLU9_9ACTN
MDTTPVMAPLQGIVVSIDVTPGQSVPAGTPLVVLESMKMEYVVVAPVAGVVREVAAVPGALVGEDETLVAIEEGDVEPEAAPAEAATGERPHLAEVRRRG